MVINFQNIPISAISTDTKRFLSRCLNPKKVILSENGLRRDWHGITSCLNISENDYYTVAAVEDHMSKLFEILVKHYKYKSIEELRQSFENIDRWDVFDDVDQLFYNDAIQYEASLKQVANVNNDNVSSLHQTENDDDIITRFDSYGFKKNFDAFLLYAEEDSDFALMVISQLESSGKYDIQLCDKERDIIPGYSFEHEAIIRLLSERCNRIILIISPNFLKSPVNSFFISYATKLAIETKQRKIIPILYQDCKIPPSISYIHCSKYTNCKSDNSEWFWDKIARSIKPSSRMQNSTKVLDIEKQINYVKENDIKENVPKVDDDDNNKVVEAMKSKVSNEKKVECQKKRSWYKNIFPKEKRGCKKEKKIKKKSKEKLAVFS